MSAAGVPKPFLGHAGFEAKLADHLAEGLLKGEVGHGAEGSSAAEYSSTEYILNLPTQDGVGATVAPGKMDEDKGMSNQESGSARRRSRSWSMSGLVLVCAAMLLSLTALTACEPPTITASFSPKTIDAGDYTTISGTLSTKKSGVAVVVERSAGGTWTKAASGHTSTGGKYAIKFRVYVTGALKYRSRAGGATSPSAYLRSLKTVYLEDVTEVAYGCGGCTHFGAITIDGVSYDHGYHAYAAYCSGSYGLNSEFDLGRKALSMTAALGLRDDSASGQDVMWRVLADGVVVASGSTAVGQTYDLNLDLHGVLRLRIESRRVPGTGGDCAFAYLGLGDPALKE